LNEWSCLPFVSSYSITPDILQHRDELSKFIGDEIARTLREQKNLERKYEELIEQRAAMKGMVNKVRYREVQDEIQEVSRALKESTNNLVRSLKENPNISGNLIKVQRDRNELNDALLRCIQELRDRGKYQSITVKVDEENHQRIRFQQLKSREKQLRENVIKLQEVLNEEQKSFQLVTQEQKQAIVHLKEELMRVKGNTTTDAKFRRKESLASVSAIWREYKHKEHILEQKVKTLEEKLYIENIVNNDTKDFLTKKLLSLQENLNHWETKYDNEISEIDANISLITTKRNNLLEKLQTLEQRLVDDKENDRVRMEQEKLEADNSKKAKEHAKKQNRASKTITKTLRGYIKRKKELETIKGGDKKSKKGGKEKKGKK
jgi:chromosome segregation ATPase